MIVANQVPVELFYSFVLLGPAFYKFFGVQSDALLLLLIVVWILLAELVLGFPGNLVFVYDLELG